MESTTITVTLPAVDDTLIAKLEETRLELEGGEVAALSVIRQKYAPYARHNGHILTSYEKIGNQNWEETLTEHYERDGRTAKALKVVDDFGRENTEEYRGNLIGTRLYLTEDGEWLQVRRTGRWSNWQGEGQKWEGTVHILTDEQVQRTYFLRAIVEGLSEALTELAKKLPERYTRLRQQTELAAKVIAALR